MNLVVVGCSRRKKATTTPVPALDLYEGWCVPALRERVGGHDTARRAVLVLSARHGLVPADTMLLPYDQPLTRRRAVVVYPAVRRAGCDLVAGADELLLLLEPRYAALLWAALARRVPRTVHWSSRPTQDWAGVCAVLDSWGWP